MPEVLQAGGRGITDTMVPEAFEDAHLLVGLITVAGFRTAFALSHR